MEGGDGGYVGWSDRAGRAESRYGRSSGGTPLRARDRSGMVRSFDHTPLGGFSMKGSRAPLFGRRTLLAVAVAALSIGSLTATSALAQGRRQTEDRPHRLRQRRRQSRPRLGEGRLSGDVLVEGSGGGQEACRICRRERARGVAAGGGRVRRRACCSRCPMARSPSSASRWAARCAARSSSTRATRSRSATARSRPKRARRA